MRKLKLSVAGRMELVAQLLDENVYDENGIIIGKKDPIITEEEALKVLQMPLDPYE